MDDTQASIKTAEAAAATRKRRSSILKSQKPQRTPFSELEFNVATPTDTAKSRRVSFSRRTGIAEFVTNEATTTWKNFYEEHNKSLESSGNESAANAPRPVIGHIGKRIFDQQFEEVEVVDIGGTLQTNTAVQEFQSSFNNVNLTQQLMAFELECVGDDKKLAAPAQHFELSNLTDHHSKVFGNDLSMPVMNEMTNPISMNFSNIQPLGKCDDLEEIARDLERPHPNIMCGPFSSKDVSEYIEVDLNMTNVVMKSDDCDMSITDTIHSPKVQAIKQTSLHETISNEALIDKENIVMNPYVAPKESENFAINEEFDQVLVFDGKKLRVQSERQPIPEVITEEIVCPKVALKPDAVPKRKTIVLNVNDDLPNFISDSSLMVNHNTNNDEDLKKSVLYNDCDLSITQAVGGNVGKPKRTTMVFDDDMGNISITQAVPAKVIINKVEKNKTATYEKNNTAEISITQAVSTNIIKTGIEKTVFYEDDLSFTKVLPGNLVLNKTFQDKTIYYQDGLDISVTKAIPDNIIKSKNIPQREENYLSNISMTQGIPSNIIIDEVKHDDNNCYDDFKDKDSKQGNIDNSNNKNEKRKTIVYDNETSNISLTQAIPTNILVENKMNIDKFETKIANESLNISNFGKPSNKRKTIIYDNDQGEISMTQAIPSNIIHMETKANDTLSNDYKYSNLENKDNRRKTILYDNEEGNISMTQVIPANIIQALDLKNEDVIAENADLVNVPENTNRRKTIIYDNENGDVSMTQAIPSNIMQPKSELIEDVKNNRRKTVVYDDQDADVSMTQVIPSNIISTKPVIDHIETNDDLENDPNMASGRRKTIIYDNNEGDVSITQLMPSNIIVANVKINKTECPTNENDMDISITHPLPTNIFTNEKNENEMNLTNVIQNNSLRNNVLNKSKILDQSNCKMNISSTKPIPAEIIDIGNEILKKGGINSCKSLFDTEFKEVSVQQDILVYQSIEHNVSRPNTETDVSFKVIDDRVNLHTSKINNTSIKCRSKSNITLKKDDFKKDDDEKEDPSKVIEENYEIENKKLIEQKSFSENNTLVVPKQNKKSILSNLLDMSNASLVVEPLDKQLINSPVKMAIENVKPENESSNRVFFITRDSENEMNKENIEIEEKISNTNEFVEVTNKDTHYSDEEELELQNESIEPVIINEKSPKSNRHYEQMLSSDLEERKLLDRSDQKTNRSVVRDIKSIRNADDTKDLLEMLSDFTDGPTEERNNKSIAANATSQMSSDEPRRLSLLPKRQSIALTREVLLNNISMAQAALQMSRSYNDSDHIEDTRDSPEETEKSPNKSVRVSTEVVKTLHFEDDSISETNMGTDMKTTPLKKTTFGETTYMKDDKTKVIPTYLKDVSDGIKALMHDLVKPSAEISSEGYSPIKKPPSTCSTQIQANIVTSSQIDISSELLSNLESNENIMQTESLESEVAALGKRAITQALRQSIKPMDISMEEDQKPVAEIIKSPFSILKQSPINKTKPSPVIVFDHLNPLNNILITQTDCSKVHGYDPIKTKDSKEDGKVQNDKIKKQQIEIERVSTHYKIEKQMSQQELEVHVEDGVEKMNESDSKVSNISKPLSIDRSTDGIVTDHKDTEINTLISMKDNKEILEANSSLTLVDDALAQPIDIDMENSEDVARQKSPVKIIYKVKEDLQKDSDVTSNDESEINSNSRKRSYSPTKRDKKLSQPADVTPKPVSKMQKISLSPKTPEANTKVIESPDKKERSPDKKKSPKKRNSIKQDLTVQQVIVDCYKDASADRNIDRKCLESFKISTHESLTTETVSDTLESMKSETTFTSSKKAISKVLSQTSEFDQKSDEDSSKSLMDFSSAVDVVRMIQMLPFMGSRDCEWETRKGDLWTFLLLRSRLRLTVRLVCPPCSDTLLADLDVSAVREEEKDPSSSLCVRFAEEAMRYECAQCVGVGPAVGLGVGVGEVPALLRRCVETARLALLWARVMRDARLRLAYQLTRDGDLTFKVANTCLRAVWEVRLRVELAVDDAARGAWPRAARVRVLPALPTPTPTPDEVRRLVDGVGNDWGHAPTTIWRLFRYLKNKTRDEDVGVWSFKN